MGNFIIRHVTTVFKDSALISDPEYGPVPDLVNMVMTVEVL
jgi:hypothetical protein